MKKNVGSQLISAQMISATDGSDQTTGTCNVAVEIDGAAGTGGTATHIANGKWEYAPIQADTNGDYLTFQFVISGAITSTLQVYTDFPQTVDNDTKITTIAADVANVDGYNLATQIGTAGAGLTNIGTIATVTTLTNLPAITTDWLTAAGTAADFTTEIQVGLATSAAQTTAQNDLDTLTGADGATLATASSAQLVDDVWDEVITSGAHNTADSSAKYVRQLRTNGTYIGGTIYIDTVNGSAGTEDYENGTDANPVNSIADANTLATSLGFTRFSVLPGSTITFAASQAGDVFEGDAWTLALGGQNIVGSVIKGATVSGVASGTGTTQIFTNCVMNACSHIKGTHILTSAIAGTQTVVEAGDYFLDRCHSGIAGAATWSWDFGAAIGNTNLNVRNYSGGIQLESMNDTGTDTASIEGQGQLIEGTCTGGAVSLRGMFNQSGITNITVTADDNTTNTAAILVDTAEIGAAGVGLTEAGGDGDHLSAIPGVSDPWLTALPGAYGVGTAGEILGDWKNGERLDVLLDAIPTTAMRGTDNAATSAKQDTMETTLNDVPTTAEFNARTLAAAAYFDPAVDAVANVTLVDTLTTYTGNTLQTGDVTTAINDLANATDGLSALKVLIDAIQTDLDNGTDGLGALKTLIDALQDISAANVNTEVSDVIKTDTITLPGQVAPPLAPTLEEAVAWLYKNFRNHKEQDASQWRLYANNGTTIDSKAVVSDDGTDAVKQKILAGP